MPDEIEVGQNNIANKPETIVKLRPTLYIGVGGTGMEVMLRVRRRILNAVWGTGRTPARVETMADFPVAQFLHFDLDHGSIIESGKSLLTDPIADLVTLTDDDKVVETFEIEKYSRSDDDLAKYPFIEDWSPLAPKKIRELGIDPSKGAGQIRAISRLYFFDKYTKVRDKIRNKLIWLKSGLSREDKLKALALDIDPTKFRIVVICSVAGGTGAGSFLDMGWLAKWIAKESVNTAEVVLMLFLPTGYQGANKDRTEANGYASLMELETCMRGGSDFAARWDLYDRPELSSTPYDDVYLIDSGNLAQLNTSDQEDVYNMVADALFDDYASIDFANKKRSVAVNQQQHKIRPFNPPVPGNRFGQMKLSYYKGYSAFGQAILDTQRNVKQDICSYRWAGEMLKVFFGVAATCTSGNRASDKQRDDFMVAHMHLIMRPFLDFPDISAKDVEHWKVSGGFTDYAITDELLRTPQGESLIARSQQKVDTELDRIATSHERNEWIPLIREAFKQLERDIVRDQDSVADSAEDRVAQNAKKIFAEVTAKLYDQLYTYLDNKEFGGLEYVQSLIEQVKDRLENPNSGLISAINVNANRYLEIRDALRTSEYEYSLLKLEQTKGGFLTGSKEKQAREILEHLKKDIGCYFKFHLRRQAASQAAVLMTDISKWLGEHKGMDSQMEPVWTGVVGELQKGRMSVWAMLGEIERKVSIMQEDTKKDHATYIKIEAKVSEIPMPKEADLREWADEAFKDLGGSRKLFPMLMDASKRSTLLIRLRNKAEAQIIMIAQSQPEDTDPLVTALEAMTSTERQRKFNELLNKAMPWINAGWGKDFQPEADQFKCYIGVGRKSDFSKFEDELKSQVPNIGVTPKQVSFVDSGVPGRAVCYCELSGIPLTVLRGLDSWKTSYRKESTAIPLHTHRDSTKFTHPSTLSASEINQLADEFHQYLLGVMLGVLTRDTNKRICPSGQFQFSVARGDARRIGNERSFRQNGLPELYRQKIIEAIAVRLEALDGIQLAALAALATNYEMDVYTPRLIANEQGTEMPHKGFPSAISEEIAREVREKARRKGVSDEELGRLGALFEDNISKWTDFIEGSHEDADSWEVRDSVQPRLKRTVKKGFFDSTWLSATVLNETKTTDQQTIFARPPSAAPPAFPGTTAVPPPLAPPPMYQYFVAINGQQHGPCAYTVLQQWIVANQLQPAALGWREGLTQWTPINQIPELLSLFANTPPLPSQPPAFPPIPES